MQNLSSEVFMIILRSYLNPLKHSQGLKVINFPREANTERETFLFLLSINNMLTQNRPKQSKTKGVERKLSTKTQKRKYKENPT